MAIWGISDLHLSLAKPGRRDRFGARWSEHLDQIEQQWRAVVRRRDLVLIPGDISMAWNHREAQPDLNWLARLPGTKVLAPGNHDGWWNNVETIRKMLRWSQRGVDGDAILEGGVVICGAQGTPVVLDDPGPEDRTATDRALLDSESMLKAALGLRDADQPLYVLWHYPPFDRHGRPGPWVEQFEEAGVTGCLYGHLHAESQWSSTVQGVRNGVHYYCVAADAIGFRPLRIDGT